MNKDGKKFLFDLHDFEREAEEEKEKRRNKNPPPPMFSLEDMESARRTAHEAGKQEGLQLAKDSIEQQTELLVQSLTDKVQELENGESQRFDDYLTHSMSMTFKALQKTLSPILDATKEDQIKLAIKSFFEEHTHKGDLTLFVHPTMMEPIEKHARILSPSMIVEKDKGLNTTQARIEWTNGVFEFNPDTLVVQILQLLEKRVPNAGEHSLDAQVKTPHNEDIKPLDEKPETQDS